MLLQSKIMACYVTISILVAIMTVLQILVCLPVSCRVMFLAHAQGSETTLIEEGSNTAKPSRLSGDEHWRRKSPVVVYSVSALGSRPPRCLNRCGKCRPCEAIQVPARGKVLQYANYEPEQWKCKCGASVFDP